jgi:hypothetical protein
VIADVLEETAGGEFRRHDQGGAAVDRHQRAEELRRGPVEGAEIVYPVVRHDAEAVGGGIDVAEMLAIVQHHAFGPRAGAGREQDDGVVVRTRGGLRVARLMAGDLGVECPLVRPVEASEPQARRRDGRQQVVQFQSVLMQNQRRLEPREDVVELVAVHLDVHGADGGPVAHDAEITEQMLDRIVGEQRHPLVGLDAAAVQERGDAAGRCVKLAIGHGPPVIGADDPRLGRVTLRRSRDPVPQQFRTWLDRHGQTALLEIP